MLIKRSATQTLVSSPSVLNFMSSHFALRDIFNDCCVVAIPTKTDFRGINIREAFLFRGPQGWSEFAPFIEYNAAESARWLEAAIEGAYKPWPELKRKSIPINATLPRIPADQVAKFLNNYPGCTTIKMKVNDFESDADRLEAVLDFLPDAKVRLDVNAGWSLSQARQYLHDYFMRFGHIFEYIEQPCESLEDLATLKSEVPMKIAVDESIRKFIGSDFSSLSEIADVAILKWAPSGGIAATHKLISEIGLPTVISSAIDTGIGISHGLALAASLDSLEYACGLGTTALLVEDIALPLMRPIAGVMDVVRAEPNPEALAKYQASAERTQWWENRVTEIWNTELREEVKGWVS